MKRLLLVFVLLGLLVIPVSAAPIRWVDLQVPVESLRYAM